MFSGATLMEMTLAVETVTPAQAKQWLDVDNHGNRTMRAGWVDYLAEEISAGRWQITHMGIALDPKGNLLDGQHRLAAIVQSDTPVQIVVARNVPPEAYMAVDRGKMRSIADVLHTDRRSTSIAAAIVTVLQVHSYNGSPSPEDVHTVLRALSEEISKVLAIRPARILSGLPIRCGVVLRIAECTPGQDTYLLDQWCALNATDSEAWDRSSAALMRRLMNERIATPRGDKSIAVAWDAFDPMRRDREQIQINKGTTRRMIEAGRAILRRRIATTEHSISRLDRALAAA